MNGHSALYEGRVTHRRHVPHAHGFSYRMAQLYLDLDEIDQVFQRRWLWSVDRPNLAEWRRSDYLDGEAGQPLAQAVRTRLRARLGEAPTGPIRLLAHPRYAGYVFNPVSFYCCCRSRRRDPGRDPGGDHEHPMETTALRRPAGRAGRAPWRRHGLALRQTLSRLPFMPMDCIYDWRFNAPGEDLRVHMRVNRQGQPQFDANLRLQRRELDGAALARLLWRFP